MTTDDSLLFLDERNSNNQSDQKTPREYLTEKMTTLQEIITAK